MDPKPQGEAPSSPSPAREGVRFLWRRRRAVAVLAGWSVAEAAYTFATGYALARALDAGFLAGKPVPGLAWLAGAAVAVLVGAYGTGRTYRGTAALAEPLRDALVRRVVARALHDGDRAAVSRLTHQVEIARDTFAGLVMVARTFVFTAVGALVGLCLLAPVLLVLVLPPLLAGLALFAVTLRPLVGRQEAFLDADEAVAKSLGDVCAGLRDVAAAGAEDPVHADTAALVDAERDAAYALARWSVVRVAALAVAGRLPVVLLLVAAPRLLDHGVSAGALAGALAYLTQSLLPGLQNLMHGLGANGSRLAVVLRRLMAEPPRPAPGLQHAAVPGAPAVALRGVTFAHGPHADPVVDRLHLALPHGSHLAVVGLSGIGKSTLAALVAGMLEPQQGEVSVCGIPARDQGARALRVLIPQEAYVFSGTVGENLRHLRTDPVPDREVLAAAEAVGAGELLDRLGGLAAPLVPAELSAGERQQIALVRAYLSPAPVVLLDEAACHLDPAAEARAERAFAARPGGTLVVIAHRAGSARRAGRVLVMDGARTTVGTHTELLQRSALYRDLMGDGGPRGDAAVSQPSRPLRYADRVDPVAGPGLPGDGGHVIAYGSVRQVQTAGDLPDGGPLRGK
ncbi:ABC transporter ATP-binding protein [Streptomyces morookaense]|nr:ABC transporter ATP-binding protein [Streptomyces morookaense]GHF33651.1 ABC transporter ATP-binding protein [Streptomyces morookaense]